MMLKLLSVFIFLAASFSAVASPVQLTGVKFPNHVEEGSEPVTVSVQATEPGAALPGFSELVPFALRSPDQQEAGSCLYMSLTGIAEWWLARLHPTISRAPDGPIDLSERYMMNIAGLDEDSNGVPNWKTDSIYLYNRAGGAMLNTNYRFTKGWYARRNGQVVPATAGATGAAYDTNYNWIDQRPVKAPLVKLPTFQRTVIYADPASNQWDTGVMPDNIADRIKTALRTNKAPVQVIYNHFGYWHSTVILGYDDNGNNNDCHFVRHFMDYMGKKENTLRAQAAKEKDPGTRDSLLSQANKVGAALTGTLRSFNAGGGCHPGVFYVRDSIYADPNGPKYEYDPSNRGADSPYVKSTVMLEYDWVRTMANHVNQITAQ
ncbi:MAG: hypothetical protein ACXVCI_06780 [Bdellovibrionota bacterium]